MADGINWQSTGMGMAGGDIADMLMQMFGGGKFKNPADAGMPYLNQIRDQLTQMFSPYTQAGTQALGRVQGEYGNLLNDPTAEMNKIGSTYQQSPGYQFALKQAENAAMNQAAAGGMAGTPQAQQRGADIAENMANRDYNQYLDTGLGLYGKGLEGEQGIANMGEQASTGLAEDLAQMLMSQANMAYAGAENQNQHRGGFWGSLGGLLKGGLTAAGLAGIL